MKIFIDTANLEQIRDAVDMGVIIVGVERFLNDWKKVQVISSKLS